MLDEGARQRLVENIAGSLKDAHDFIQDRVINNFAKVNADFGARLRKAIEGYRNDKVGEHFLLRKTCVPNLHFQGRPHL